MTTASADPDRPRSGDETVPEPTHLEARFTFERSTKNTKVFSEQGSQPAIGTLYVQKDALERLGNPTELRVILQSADT